MKILLIAGIVGVVIVAVVFLFAHQSPQPQPQPQPQLGALSKFPNSYNGGVTNSSSSVSSTAVQVLAQNLNRVFAQCTNDNASTGNDVYCSKSATSTDVNAREASRLNAGSGRVIFDELDPYTGALWCLTLSGTSTLSCEER